ncbi:MAG: hypothetical protein ABIC04_03270 [Nanoarchaeota archaeon]
MSLESTIARIADCKKIIQKLVLIRDTVRKSAKKKADVLEEKIHKEKIRSDRGDNLDFFEQILTELQLNGQNFTFDIVTDRKENKPASIIIDYHENEHEEVLNVGYDSGQCFQIRKQKDSKDTTPYSLTISYSGDPEQLHISYWSAGAKGQKSYTVFSGNGYAVAQSSTQDTGGYAATVNQYGSVLKSASTDPLNSNYVAQAVKKQANELKQGACYLEKQNLKDNNANSASNPCRLELVVKRSKPGILQPLKQDNYNSKPKSDSYNDYFTGHKERVEKYILNQSGPEPPQGDPKILPRDSLLFSVVPGSGAYKVIGSVQYEQGKSSSMVQDNQSQNIRFNPSEKAGEVALSSQAYQKISQGTGSFAPVKKAA